MREMCVEKNVESQIKLKVNIFNYMSMREIKIMFQIYYVIWRIFCGQKQWDLLEVKSTYHPRFPFGFKSVNFNSKQ